MSDDGWEIYIHISSKQQLTDFQTLKKAEGEEESEVKVIDKHLFQLSSKLNGN